MKLETKESLIAISYFITVLATLALLFSFYLPNLVLIGLLWLLATAIATRKLRPVKKKALIVLLAAAIGVYLWYPKKVSTCGILAQGDSCETVSCQGLPAQSTNTSFCMGSYVMASY